MSNVFFFFVFLVFSLAFFFFLLGRFADGPLQSDPARSQRRYFEGCLFRSVTKQVQKVCTFGHKKVQKVCIYC